MLRSLFLVLPLLYATSIYASELNNKNKEPYTKPILPLPVLSITHKDKVVLGGTLFHDPLLSAGQGMSCATCHNLEKGGDDDRVVSLTVSGTPREINTPTVFNAIYNQSFTWTGKQENLDGFLHILLRSPKVLNAEIDWVLEALRSKPDYLKQFNQLYKDGVTVNNLVDALAHFQEQLTTPNSRFDNYLRGDKSAISLQEKRGYSLFQSYGCISCHQGINVGGNMYQKLGLFGDYIADSGRGPVEIDNGRYLVTGEERDRFYFRVPSLRNVALTAPYLHDGSIENLDDTVEVMAKYQLGRKIPETDRQDIVAFLKSLTGQYKGRPLDAIQ